MKLTDAVYNIPTVGRSYFAKLKKLQIETIEDLINHIPRRYKDFTNIKKIKGLEANETASVIVNVDSIKNEYTRKRFVVQKAVVSDETGVCNVIWFNQRFIPRNIPKGSKVCLSGIVERVGNKIVISSPEYEIIKDSRYLIHTARLVPVYPETKGISSKWLRSKIHTALDLICDSLEEFLERDILGKYALEDLVSSYKKVHFPESLSEAASAKKRLAFNEFLFLHFKSFIRKNDWQNTKPSYRLIVDKKIIKDFTHSLPFTLTPSQTQSAEEILADLEKNYPMNRLLEGDVGSGKTAVAAIAAFVSFINEKQTVIMAPTQILAQQHFDTLNNLFGKYKIRVSLITSETQKKALGKTDIFVGTHALIHKKVIFDNVALVVIDEQHRFGVEQRAHLVKRSKKEKKSPHVLTMTATPIPRTVALTVYGDLDLSTLKELPKGRKRIKTWIVPEIKRQAAYVWIEKLIKLEKIQAFVICPLIEESVVESMQQIRAATAEYESLKSVFPNLTLGLLHGKLISTQKLKVVELFRNGKIDILVSTPVVEVGIDVANATVMLIEGSERFGLAQLHQLRGRVGRGDKQSYCLLFTKTTSGNSIKRLKAMERSMSGFELAELDLNIRGPGEIVGVKQHGFGELKIASWGDINLIKVTKEAAQMIYKRPTMFKKITKYLNLADIAMN